MSVPFPILTRGIWIPDPNFSHPISGYNYWTPTGISSARLLPFFSSDTVSAGRVTAVQLDGIGTGWDGDRIESSFSDYGVAAGPLNTSWVSSLRFRVFLYAYFSGSWNAHDDRIRVRVDGYDEDMVATESTGQLYFEDVDGTSINTTAHTTPTLFTAATKDSPDTRMTTDTTTRYYRLRLEFRDGTGAGNRYCNLIWCGLSMPWANNDAYANPTNDSLTSWYDAAPNISARRRSVKGRGSQQQLLALQFNELSTDDLDHIRANWYWNDGTPTDDVQIGISNRGNRSPVILALNRDDVKPAFYADMGALGYNNAINNMWPESGGRFSAPFVFTERLEK